MSTPRGRSTVSGYDPFDVGGLPRPFGPRRGLSYGAGDHRLGAQHDARLLSDGTLTVFDNRTDLPQARPRAVRYRIDESARTATLLRSITDPDVAASFCCGSARRLPNSDWLINWGQGSASIGGYKPDGERTFLLKFDSTFSYRAQPVPPGAVSAQQLRDGMDAMCASGCG
jgi:Arylsulfotransferase (ASST)